MDGKWLITGDEGNIVLLDSQTGTKTHEFKGHEDYVTALAFSMDGQWIASGSWDQTLRIWSVSGGNQAKSFKMDEGYAKSVCFSPDGKFLLAGSTLSGIEMWEISSGLKVKVFTGHKDEVRDLAFSPRGKTFVSVSMDGTLKNWDVQSGTLIRNIEAHSEAIYNVRLSRDGNLAITGSADKTMKVWDLSTGNEILKARGHRAEVLALAQNGKGILASGGLDRAAYAWEISSAQEISVHASSEVNHLAFHPNGRLFAAVNNESVKTIEVATGKLIREFTGHENIVRWAAFSKNGEFLYSTGWDGKVIRWNASTGEIVQTISIQQSVECALLWEERDMIVCAHYNGNLSLWSLSKAEKLRMFKAHNLVINAVELVQNGKYLLTGSEDEQISLWDTNEWSLVASQKTGIVKKACILPYSSSVALALQNKGIEIWTLFPFRQKERLEQNTIPFSMIVLDDESLLVGNSNGTIYFYRKN